LEARKDWIAKRIKEIRKERHITQAELAGTSGLPQSHISRLEAGLHSPSFKTVEKIAKALGVEVGEIDPAND
jgi:transcriptional regulator with XRE-family HTH domain